MNRIMQSSLALFWAFASQTSWALPAEATDDVINGDEDTAITGNLLVNDLVDPGSGKSLYAVAPPASGGLTWDGSGEITYTPPLNFNGVISFTYTLKEELQACEGATPPGACFDEAAVTINVAPQPDAPIEVNALRPVPLMEDSEPVDIEVGSVFQDPEGDALTYSVVPQSGMDAVFESASVVGSTLSLALAANQNGTGVLILTANDGTESTESLITVNVAPVNDPPVVTGAIADLTVAEDQVVDPYDIGVFDDPDIQTNGDSLTYSVSDNTNADLFAALSFSGSDLVVELSADANGDAELTIRASDTSGAWVETTFNVTVSPVNDVPVANADTLVIAEDAGEIRIPVLANDYLAEEPTIVLSFAHTGTHQALDQFDNTLTLPNAQIRLDGNELVYESTANFNGEDVFTYTIADVDGDSAMGVVTVTVTGVNDPPEGVVNRAYTMNENEVLTVNVAAGLLRGSFDPDALELDGNGNPPGLSAQIETLPSVGVLDFDPVDGSFTYTPPINFVGTVTFSYRLFDDSSVSVDPVYTAEIEVNEVVANIVTPTPGEVSVNFNLAQTPLETAASVPPNVMVLMDDSGSMDMNLIVSGEDTNGGLLLANRGIATQQVRQRSLSYLWDLDNTYPATSAYGGIAPTQAALDLAMPGNEYGVWRLRNHRFNKLYYNPAVRYTPWVGQDESGAEFTNAQIDRVRLNPVDDDATFDLLSPVGYTSTDIPIWRSQGGSANIVVSGVYLPHYYTTSADAPIGHDAPRNRIDIVPGETYPGGPGRDDCRPGEGDNPNVCTYEQEIQNFANFLQYHRNREFVAKNALSRVIEDAADVRVGLDTVSAATSVSVADMNELHTEGAKKEFLDTLHSFDSSGGTPLRRLLSRGAQKLGCQVGDDCPALPAPEGICQQNFALMFTDGYWNGGTDLGGNADGDGNTAFDGGRYADTVSQTLADIAMQYYETDLFPAVKDGVPVSNRDIAGAPAGFFDDVQVMHQHVKTYAIAFGVRGTIEDTEEAENWPVNEPYPWTNPFSDTKAKLDDVLHTAVNGRGDFLSAGDPQELQSAMSSAFREFSQATSSASAVAFNSTALRDETLLYRGFYDLRNRSGELVARQVDSQGVINPTPVWLASEQLDPAATKTTLDERDDRIIVTWNPESEKGVPFRYDRLAATQTETLTPEALNFVRGDRSEERQNGGDLRNRAEEGGLLGTIVSSSPVFVGSPRAINRDQAPYPVDDLYSDFAADKDDRTPMVYVGANDGMMHGFRADATGGQEIFGYVPSSVIDSNERFANKLEDFTSPYYLHNYFVDLSPRLNDVYMRPSVGAGKQWTTALVGGLGAGGKGYFALNVTDPDVQFANESAASASILWEFTDNDDTYPLRPDGTPLGGSTGALTDPDNEPVKDLGYALSLPLVQMTNHRDGGAPARNEWAAIFGNGANSTSGVATLFVLFMDRGLDGWGSGDFVKISTGYGVPLPGEPLAGFPNALGAPTAIDVDLNGTVDYVYAGDRLGNLFRFDLTSPDPANWKAVRIFQATYDAGAGETVQPILSRPLVVKNPDGPGFMVIVGTGSFLTQDDANSSEIQSLYGIWDRPEDDNPATAGADTKADRLVEQIISNIADDSGNRAQTRRVLTRNDVTLVADGVEPGTYGWYVDLDVQRATTTTSGNTNPDSSGLAPPSAQFPGEKAIRRLLFRDGALITTTVLPSVDEFSCTGARPGALLVMNAFTGGDFEQAIIDFNTDTYVDERDLVTVNGEAYSAGLLFNQEDLDGALVDLSTLGGEGGSDFLFVTGGDDTVAYRIKNFADGRTGRLSWLEVSND